MVVNEVINELSCEILAGKNADLNVEVGSVFASDMMSDVLAGCEQHTLLVTGLCNPQVIRTAEMLDISCIIFVRGKNPTPQMIELAEDMGIIVLQAPMSMYTICGKLYAAGIKNPKRGN